MAKGSKLKASSRATQSSRSSIPEDAAFRRKRRQRRLRKWIVSCVTCAFVLGLFVLTLLVPINGLKPIRAVNHHAADESSMPKDSELPEFRRQTIRRLNHSEKADDYDSQSEIVHRQASDFASDVPIEEQVQARESKPSGSLRSKLSLDAKQDYSDSIGILETESGRVINVAKIFEREREEIENRLVVLAKRNALLRFNHENSSATFLLVSRRGSLLHGPQASYYPDGSSTCLIDYDLGKRGSSILTWDQRGRPLMFGQYEKGVRHGLRCLHKACSEKCTEGHLWLVQEWRRGILQKSHLVPEDGKTRTFEYSGGQPKPGSNTGNDELALAHSKLEEFDEIFAANEEKLVTTLANIDLQERKRTILLRQAALASYRNRFLTIRKCSSGG